MPSTIRDKMIAALAVAGLDITGTNAQLRKRLLTHMLDASSPVNADKVETPVEPPKKKKRQPTE